MSNPEFSTLEGRLQALLCGDLEPCEVREVLGQVASSEPAQRLLREMLDLERKVRAAYGYDKVEVRMQTGLTQLLGLLKANEKAASSKVEVPDAPVVVRPTSRLRRLIPYLAAAAVVVVALGVALSAQLQVRTLRNEAARLAARAEMPGVSEAERQGFSRLWNEVAEGAGNSRPWILMANGEGQFGYLPASSPATSGERLLLVRCVLTKGDASKAETVCLLVPARDAMRVSLLEVGRLGGQPISCDITTTGGWATVGLTVGKDAADAVGVRGRVGIGEKSVEIGELHLNGGLMRVMVQDLVLTENVG